MLGASQAVSALLILARNVAIANLISVGDFGIASTFALAVTLVETGTNVALDRFAVQDPRGGRRSFIAALHTAQALRGILGCVLLLTFGPAFSSIMGGPHLRWAYQFLALIPLVRGFLHPALYRAQRRPRFAPPATSIFLLFII